MPSSQSPGLALVAQMQLVRYFWDSHPTNVYVDTCALVCVSHLKVFTPLHQGPPWGTIDMRRGPASRVRVHSAVSRKHLPMESHDQLYRLARATSAKPPRAFGAQPDHTSAATARTLRDGCNATSGRHYRDRWSHLNSMRPSGVA